MPVLACAPAMGVAEVVAGLGGNLLATTVERAWDRLRGEQRETAVSREDLRINIQPREGNVLTWVSG
jgi:hypothetical protein